MQSHFILLDCCKFQFTIEPFVVDNDFSQVLRFFVANQSDDVSRKSLSISAILFLLMICLSYLV